MKMKDKYKDPCQRTKKTCVTVVLIVAGALRTVSRGLGKRLQELELRGKMEMNN